MFTLHPQLKQDTFFVHDLALCQLVLMNNALFPWVILIPRIDNAREIIDLPISKRHLLMDEISLISEKMQDLFTPDKLNIGALGNVVAQLHIHIIARFKSDPAWPSPVWGKTSELYKDPEPLIQKLKQQVISL